MTDQHSPENAKALPTSSQLRIRLAVLDLGVTFAVLAIMTLYLHAVLTLSAG